MEIPFTITVDGCDYMVTVTHGGDIITVYALEGVRIADAERDALSEHLLYDHFNEEDGRLEDFSGSIADLYSKPAKEIAEWLVSTYPSA